MMYKNSKHTAIKFTFILPFKVGFHRKCYTIYPLEIFSFTLYKEEYVTNFSDFLGKPKLNTRNFFLAFNL